MNISTDFKAAKASAKSWVGVLGFGPESKTERTRLGEMLALMSISSEVDFDLAAVGGWLFDELQDTYFHNTAEQIKIGDLEKAMQAVKRRLDEILEREEGLAETGVDLQLVVAVVKEQVLYLGVVGEVKVYILRGEDFAEVGSALVDAQMDGFARSGSMYLQADDRILLVTREVAATHSEQTFKQSLSDFDLQEALIRSGGVVILGCDVPPKPQPLPEEPAPELKHPLSTEAEMEGDEDTKDAALEMDRDLDQQEDVDAEEQPVAALPRPKIGSESGLAHRAKKFAAVAWQGAGTYGKSLRQQVSSRLNRSPKSSKPATEHYIEDNHYHDDSGLEPESNSNRGSGVSAQLLKLWGTVQTLSSKLLGTVKEWLGMGLDRQQLYLRGVKPGRNWRLLVVIALVVIVILFLGLRQLANDRERESKARAVESQISQLEDEMDTLATQVTTAGIGTGQEVFKEQVLADLQELLTKTSKLRAEQISTSKIDAVTARANEAQDQLLSVKAFTQPQLITDLGASNQGAVPADIAYHDGQIYVVDSGRGVVYRMGTALSSEASSWATGLQSPYTLDVDEDGDVVVVDKATEGGVISTINKTNGTVFRHPGVSLSKIGALQAIDIWTNAALYSLSRDKKAVLKQENVGGNYQLPNDASPWYSNAGLSLGQDIAVDYWVYLLVDGEGLQRFLGGAPVEYAFSGLITADQVAIKRAKAIEFTDANFYVADPINKRILAFSKRLDDANVFDFKAQYVYRGSENIFSDIKDIVVNQAANQIYVLDGAKVIRIDM